MSAQTDADMYNNDMATLRNSDGFKLKILPNLVQEYIPKDIYPFDLRTPATFD
jgi:hypothetical protein